MTDTERGHYHLWELTNGSREEIYTLAIQVAEEMSQEGQLLRKSEWDEPSQSLVYAVHQYLWQRSGKSYTRTPPFTARRDGVRIISVLRALIPNLEELFTYDQLSRLSRTVYSILANNMLVRRVGGSGSKRFLIREWPEGFVPEWFGSTATFTSQKDEVDLKRQDRKAKKLAGKVESSLDLTMIPPPDPTAESVMAYIKKVMPVAIKLQSENKDLRQELKDLKESKDWAAISDEITDLTK